MMRIAKELLKQLTERFPPGANQHHGITLTDNGDLQITLMLGDQFLPIMLEDSDLDRDASDLVDEICHAIKVEHGELP